MEVPEKKAPEMEPKLAFMNSTSGRIEGNTLKSKIRAGSPIFMNQHKNQRADSAVNPVGNSNGRVDEASSQPKHGPREQPGRSNPASLTGIQGTGVRAVRRRLKPDWCDLSVDPVEGSSCCELYPNITDIRRAMADIFVQAGYSRQVVMKCLPNYENWGPTEVFLNQK